MRPVAYPDIWLGGTHYLADPDIRIGGNLICFPVSDVYFFFGGGPKSIAKLVEGVSQIGGVMARFAPPDQPLCASLQCHSDCSCVGTG